MIVWKNVGPGSFEASYEGKVVATLLWDGSTWRNMDWDGSTWRSTDWKSAWYAVAWD